MVSCCKYKLYMALVIYSLLMLLDKGSVQIPISSIGGVLLNLETYKITSKELKKRIKEVKIERKRLLMTLWDSRIDYIILPFLRKVLGIRKKIK